MKSSRKIHKNIGLLAVTGIILLLAGLTPSAPRALAQSTLQFVDGGPLAGGSCIGVALGDLDGDGDLDIVLACTSLESGSPIFFNQGGTPVIFTQDESPSTAGLGANVFAVALGDLDGDSDLDLLVNTYEAGYHLDTWINQGGAQGGNAGQLEKVQRVLSSSLYSGLLALGDLDGDGDVDAFETGPFRPDKVWANDGSGMFSQLGPNLPNGAGAKVALGDLDGDGDLDAYVATGGSTEEKVWVNQGGRQGGIPGTFADSGLLLGAANTVDVALADVNRDAGLDAVVANYGAGNVDAVYLNQTPAGGNLSLVLDTRQQFTATNSRALALGDLDGDGDVDALFGAINGTFRVFLNDGQGVFAVPPLTFGTAGAPPIHAVALGDLDHDGDLDAVVVAGLGSNIWMNQPLPVPVAQYSSYPPPGSEINLATIYASNPYLNESKRWLRLSNVGTAPLTISSIDLPQHNQLWFDILDSDRLDPSGVPLGNNVALPHQLPGGSTLSVLITCSTLLNNSSNDIKTTLTVESDDPSLPEASYSVVCNVIMNAKSQWFETVLMKLNQGVAPAGASMRAATASVESVVTCNDSVTLALDSSAPHSLTMQIPGVLGGGTLELSEFGGSLTVGLQPIPADAARCAFRVAGGTFSAQSLQLPSGIATGPNTLTFGPATRSDGVLDLATGAFTATATGTIVNDLFPEGIAIAGSYSGTADFAAGRVDVQSQTWDFIPVSTTEDATPPEITPVANGPLGANGWYVGDVSVSWMVSDPETNITAIDGCNTATVTVDTPGQTFTCSASSGGGTSTAPPVTVKRDATRPAITCPADVTVTGGQAVDLGTPTVSDAMDAAPTVVNNAPASFAVGTTAVVWTATDDAGNRAECAQQVTVHSAESKERVVALLAKAVTRINALDDGAFKFKWMKNVLAASIKAAIKLVQEGHHRLALATLESWALPKMDGCADQGAPDKGWPLREYDWLITCAAQGQVYPVVLQATEMLRDLE